MLANFSVGRDTNINILETIQMFSAAWKILSAATIMNCFHRVGIVPQLECKSESESDANMVNNWQHLYQKLDVEVAFDDFTGVDNDAIVVQEFTKDEIV
jgi:hypothetical protein